MESGIYFLKNGTPHSRYLSDELGVPNFFIKTQNKCLLYRVAYGIIQIWKKICLLLRRMSFHMVEDMCILYSTILFVESIVLCSYRK